MTDEEARFTSQKQFGRPYNEDEFLIFNVAVRYPETIVSFHDRKSYHKASYYIHYYVKSCDLLLALFAILILYTLSNAIHFCSSTILQLYNVVSCIQRHHIRFSDITMWYISILQNKKYVFSLFDPLCKIIYARLNSWGTRVHD